MAIPEQFKNFKSYSRYRGFGDKYDLSDEYFATIINGNLLCTDTECDIDCDGNICLITPEGDCFHIGTIPQTEDGSKPVFSFDGNHTLVVKYKVYYDNDHHHGGYETIKNMVDVVNSKNADVYIDTLYKENIIHDSSHQCC